MSELHRRGAFQLVFGVVIFVDSEARKAREHLIAGISSPGFEPARDHLLAAPFWESIA